MQIYDVTWNKSRLNVKCEDPKVPSKSHFKKKFAGKAKNFA